MTLQDYLDGMRNAATADELEAAIRADFKHSYRGRTWAQICRVRVEAGARICASHPLGRYVPSFGPGRSLSCCGETYRVARGGNSTGIRYAWHDAKAWANEVLMRNGFGIRAANRIWDHWSDYPHRCLAIVQAALGGEIPDPELNVLIRHARSDAARPINYSVEQNDRDTFDRRATRPCPSCGGTLFDWGADHSEGFYFVNWHCNVCPDVFTEYMSGTDLAALRSKGRLAA